MYKEHPTIGCCGIDCGLCPRYQSKSPSACPGCGGAEFEMKHPSCGFLTCCFSKNNLEVCSLCKQYPCNRFSRESDGYDSFVTHRKIFQNHDLIREHGIENFISKQSEKMSVLSAFLINYDDGRSMSFFCLACALLPVEKLLEVKLLMEAQGASLTVKEKNVILKEKLQKIAIDNNIILKLNNKR